MDELLPPVTSDAFILEGRTRRFGPKQWLFLSLAVASFFILGLFILWIIGLATHLPLPTNTVILSISGRSSTLPQALTSPLRSSFFPRVAGFAQNEAEELIAFAYIPRWKNAPNGYITLSKRGPWQLISATSLPLSEQTVTPFSLSFFKAAWLSEGMVRIIPPTPIEGVSSITFYKKGSLWKSDLPFAAGVENASTQEGVTFFLAHHPHLQNALLPLFGLPSIKEPLTRFYQSWNSDTLELFFENSLPTSTIASLLPLIGEGAVEVRSLSDGTVARVLRSPTAIPELPITATTTDGRAALLTATSLRVGDSARTPALTPSCKTFTTVASFSPIPSSFPFVRGQALFVGSSDGMLALCLHTEPVDNQE